MTTEAAAEDSKNAMVAEMTSDRIQCRSPDPYPPGELHLPRLRSAADVVVQKE